MNRLIIFIVLAFSCKAASAQDLLKGTVSYQLNYNIPQQGRKAMERSGFAMTTGLQVTADGSNVNIKMMSDQGIKMEILYLPTGSFYLDRLNKKAYKTREKKDDTVTALNTTTVTRTEEFDTILGHKCRKYILDHQGRSKEFVWASTDYKMSQALYDNISGSGTENNSYSSQIEGLPLRVTSGNENEKPAFEMKATSISDAPPAATDFVLPADFTILPYNQTVVGKMLMGRQ